MHPDMYGHGHTAEVFQFQLVEIERQCQKAPVFFLDVLQECFVSAGIRGGHIQFIKCTVEV